MLYHVPIEPYETRYTADWIEQFEYEFRKAGVKFRTILGERVTQKIGTGSVLDACGTNIFKLTQLQKLIKLINEGEIKSGDILFFCDLWFPGIESLFYIRNITKIDFKIVGILHAGTYDPADFTCREGMRSWGKYLELSWFSEFDMIFSATQFHKELILKGVEASLYSFPAKGELIDKIKVTGIPFYSEQLKFYYPIKEKENIVIFPHRTDKEKHPEMFDLFSKYIAADGFKFIKTIEETKSRDEYFQLLAKSKIMLSFAEQETFGYSTLEAMALGNVVIVPDRLSYVETVPEQFRYSTMEEATRLFELALSGELKPDYPYLTQWEKSAYNMIMQMKAGGYNV